MNLQLDVFPPSIWKILPLSLKILHFFLCALFSLSVTPVICRLALFVMSYTCLPLSYTIHLFCFFVVWSEYFLLTSSLIHFSDMYNLLLSLLPFSWLSFWQIFYLFYLLTKMKQVLHEYLQSILCLSSQKQIKIKWVNFALISNFNKWRSWSIIL